MTIIQFDRSATSPTNNGALLSPRETEVLRLVAVGLNNAEIATELFISVPTVKTHVSQVLRKMQARDRVALVVAAYTSGLMTRARRNGPKDRPGTKPGRLARSSACRAR